jgi:hypothetical protein
MQYEGRLPDQGLRLAATKYYGTIRYCHEGIWRIRQPFARRYRVPNREAFLEYRTVPFCAKAVTAGTKVLTDATVGSQKTLSVTG